MRLLRSGAPERRIGVAHLDVDVPPPSVRAMIAILCAQTFTRGIPAGLSPTVRASARIAHKTGELSTATHDAGIVFLDGRAPSVLAVLTGASGSAEDRYAPIAQVSAAVFEALKIGRV